MNDILQASRGTNEVRDEQQQSETTLFDFVVSGAVYRERSYTFKNLHKLRKNPSRLLDVGSWLLL